MTICQSYQPGSTLHVALCRLAATALAACLCMSASHASAQATQEAQPQGAAPQQQETEGTITERQFKDWTVRCGRQSEQGPQVCEMQQQQTDNEGRTVMAVAVGQVPQTPDLGLLIMLPLGILLPAGVSLQIDGGAEAPLQVDRCERQGCRVEMLLEPDLLNRLKAGSKATVFFEAIDPQGERQRLGVPISLLGFTAALDEVTS
jgi:invasion protein IalB